MALLSVATPFNIELEFALAPFGKRLLAWIIDMLIQYAYVFIMLFFIFDNIFSDVSYGIATEFFIFKIVILLPALLYPLVMEVFNNGRTVGKLAMGLKVLNKEGASPSLSQYAIRWMINVPNFAVCGILINTVMNPYFFISLVIVAVFTALPAAISIAVTNYSQRLADLAAGTVVVDYQYRMHIADTIYMEVNDTAYKVLFPQVLKLSDRDINGIRNLLNNKPTKDTENFMLRVAYRIEEVLQVKMNSEPRQFLQTLMKDYNYLTQNN